jgi:hypothetical protein
MNDELREMMEEATVVYINVLSRAFLAEAEEHHEKPQLV